MVERELTTLLDGGGFFEGPRWHGGLWCVSDFYRGVAMTVAPDGSTEEFMAVEQQPSGLGWMPDGSLLVVSMKDHRILRRASSGAVSVHAELASHCGGHVNDMVVDAQGRAYVGEFGFDLQAFADPAPASLMRVDPDGSIAVLADDRSARAAPASHRAARSSMRFRRRTALGSSRACSAARTGARC
jgi:sugar lactone lactonase YvrE